MKFDLSKSSYIMVSSIEEINVQGDDIVKFKTFLYVGAGWDAYPLTLQHIRENHDLIVYVDALPNVPHYTPEQMGYPSSISEEAIMGALAEDGGYLFMDKPHKDATGSWTVALKNDVALRYFFNVSDVDILNNEAIAALLPSVITMWCAGFSPDDSVFANIPNLETVCATEICKEYLPALPDSVKHVLVMEGEFEDGKFVEYEFDKNGYAFLPFTTHSV